VWIALDVSAAGIAHAVRSAKRAAQPDGFGASRDQITAPLAAGNEVVGLLHLECPRAFSAERHANHLRVFAKAIVLKRAPRAASYGVDDLLKAQTGRAEEEGKRTLMLATLEQEGWNIRRAAKKLGVTRRTIYLSLARWGIARYRPPKS
jgi:transcriptional regulator with GAF, ATPase, and Fis domain